MLNRKLIHAFSVVSMIFGAASMVGIIGILNKPADFKDETITKAVAFNLPPKIVKPKTKPKPKPKQIRQSQPQKSVAPPAPNLSSAIAGLSFELPGFSSSDIADNKDDFLEGAGNSVMTEDSVDKRPQQTKLVNPQFPGKARQQGIEGFVKLNLFITKDGTVQKVKVLESEPKGVFDEAAIVAAKQWEFEPAEYNNEPVAAWFKRKIAFKLQ